MTLTANSLLLFSLHNNAENSPCMTFCAGDAYTCTHTHFHAVFDYDRFSFVTWPIICYAFLIFQHFFFEIIQFLLFHFSFLSVSSNEPNTHTIISCTIEVAFFMHTAATYIPLGVFSFSLADRQMK